MNQTEKRCWLIKELQADMPEYGALTVPETPEEQKKLLRSLMNVRPPKPVSEAFLQVQDEYLREESRLRGMCDGMTLPGVKADERISLWKGDITALKVGAIVNAANSALRGCFIPCHACIDNAIHSFAGIQLRLECDALMNRQGYEEPVGHAKLTRAYNLPCSYVLHTVGPVIQGRVSEEDRNLLASCYRSCLETAADNGITSVAFCCISTGVFHFPNRPAAEIAVKTVREFLEKDTRMTKIVFNVFKDSDLEIYQDLLN